ncbi:MAG: cytochrome c3 family protein [Bacteroidia bacterium]
MYSDFLVASSQNSNLCVACHQQPSWSTSSHNTSTKTWNQTGVNPWPYTPWTNVADNACASCHNSHNAGSNDRLMRFATEEDNCLVCHNGNAASKNVQADFAKAYKHNVYGYTGVHNPTETGVIVNKHVECVDCHNPHMAKTQTAVAPAVKGSLSGVSGVDQNGAAVAVASFEYEVCYKCHSDNAATPSTTPRVIVQNNNRLEFAATNPSFHPVAAIGINTNGPSLIAPLTVTSRIYCSDCHASSGTGVPAGPHGSIYPQILKLQYLRTDNTTYNANNFALCYSCHSSTSIYGNQSFSYHKKHIDDVKASCNTCHDPHGVSSLQGNATNNSNLINFNTTYVTPSNSGKLRFEDTGFEKGRCYLKCHGKNHDPLSY